MIYIWKILEGLVPNIGDTNGIRHTWCKRRGRECKPTAVKSSASKRIQTIRHASFAVNGPRLFNSLPKHIRNTKAKNKTTDAEKRKSVDEFKRGLDRYLAEVPDEPLIPGYTVYRRIESNIIVD